MSIVTSQTGSPCIPTHDQCPPVSLPSKHGNQFSHNMPDLSFIAKFWWEVCNSWDQWCLHGLSHHILKDICKSQQTKDIFSDECNAHSCWFKQHIKPMKFHLEK